MPFLILIIGIFSFIFLLASSVNAQCPVCIVTLGGGMLLARKFGVDDFLMSLWLSALNTAFAFWLVTKIKVKFLNNPLILSLAFYLTSIAYFYFSSQLIITDNLLLGINKIILGLTLGALAVIGAYFTDRYLRSQNNGKVYIYYQKVILPVSYILLLTFSFKFFFHL